VVWIWGLRDAEGSDVYLNFDESGKVESIFEAELGASNDYYASRPIKSNDEDVDSAMFFVSLQAKYEDYRDMKFEPLRSGIFGKYQLLEDTSCYVYDYDYDSIRSETSDWKDILNHNFEKGKNIKKVDIKDMIFDKKSAYVISVDMKDKNHIKNIIKIEPNSSSILEGELEDNLFKSDESGEIIIPIGTKMFKFGTNGYVDFKGFEGDRERVVILLDGYGRVRYVLVH
jgi:hypothetical protein